MGYRGQCDNISVMEQNLAMWVALLFCIGASVATNSSRISGDDDRCGPNKYYDEQRLVCLDLCGRYNETRCKIDWYCSTTASWGNRVNPPRCLPICIHHCDSPQYCDHEENECRPCDSLCSRPDVTQCRKYCYDVYEMLMTASPDITTPQTTTAADANPALALTYEVDNASWISGRSQNLSWKTIAVVFICVSMILLFGLVGSILRVTKRYRQKSASMAGGEAGNSFL